MISSAPDPHVPMVVILGAGYAGALIARSLEEDCKKGKIQVTVIERRDSFHHKIGAIRASVRGTEWGERCRIPLNRIVKNARTVVGTVLSVDEIKKEVLIENQPNVKFDILVCATGTTNHSPGDLPPHIVTKDEQRAYFRSTSAAIKNAKDIIIVGGGASAVEYAGEIRDLYPEKPLTIICSASHLMSSSIAPMSSKFLKQLYETLEKRNITLYREEKVIKPKDADFFSKKFEIGPLKVETKGNQNLTLETDLMLWAATWTVNAAFYPQDWINEMGELNIRPSFQLVERCDVFAVGDVSSLSETKQAITLPGKMKLIRNNIIKVAETMRKGTFNPREANTKGIVDYAVTDRVTMYLPVGEKFGVSQIGRWVYGASTTSKSKGRDLYTNLFWKLLTGVKAPVLVGE